MVDQKTWPAQAVGGEGKIGNGEFECCRARSGRDNNIQRWRSGPRFNFEREGGEIEAHRAIHVRWGRERRSAFSWAFSMSMPVKVAGEDLDMPSCACGVVDFWGDNK